MLSRKYIRENSEKIKKALIEKQLQNTLDVDELLELDANHKEMLQKVEDHRALKNQLSENISKVDAKERQKLIDEATEVKNELFTLETELKVLESHLNQKLLWVPNVPADDVPFGEDETGNVTHRTVGDKPQFSFKPQHHLDIGQNLNILDTERGTKLAGFRGYFVRGAGMLLEQAILRYALDVMIEKGFEPMAVPLMVSPDYLVGTGYFPWGEEDHYKTQDEQVLIGTAEVSLTAYYANETLSEDQLPIKMVGLSPCFRREIGSHGRDTRGVVRVHHFNKVEQVVLTVADEDVTRDWHETMLGYTEEILQSLGVHYRVLLMCTGDMGAGQRKKYDIEVWCPGLDDYKEMASASYFNDFQSRRLNMRYKTKDGDTKYVYTLNNTVIPTPRMLAAVLENYQQEDGSVVIPDVLKKYMNGIEIIKPSTL